MLTIQTTRRTRRAAGLGPLSSFVVALCSFASFASSSCREITKQGSQMSPQKYPTIYVLYNSDTRKVVQFRQISNLKSNHNPNANLNTDCNPDLKLTLILSAGKRY